MSSEGCDSREMKGMIDAVDTMVPGEIQGLSGLREGCEAPGSLCLGGTPFLYVL